MLDKLNQIAKMIEDAIASHPESKKKKPATGAPEENEAEDMLESPSAESSEDKAARAQKSVRKSLGGMKEPI